MKNKNIIVTSLIGIGLSLSLTACGGGGGDDSSNPTPSPEPTSLTNDQIRERIDKIGGTEFPNTIEFAQNKFTFDVSQFKISQ